MVLGILVKIPNPKAAGSPSGGVRGRQEGAGFCVSISHTVVNLISHSVVLLDGIHKQRANEIRIVRIA